MRKVACLEVQGLTVQEILSEFNERRTEWGITSEDDIISIQCQPATEPINVHTERGGQKAKVLVHIFFWQKEA